MMSSKPSTTSSIRRWVRGSAMLVASAVSFVCWQAIDHSADEEPASAVGAPLAAPPASNGRDPMPAAPLAGEPAPDAVGPPGGAATEADRLRRELDTALQRAEHARKEAEQADRDAAAARSSAKGAEAALHALEGKDRLPRRDAPNATLKSSWKFRMALGVFLVLGAAIVFDVTGVWRRRARRRPPGGAN